MASHLRLWLRYGQCIVEWKELPLPVSPLPYFDMAIRQVFLPLVVFRRRNMKERRKEGSKTPHEEKTKGKRRKSPVAISGLSVVHSQLSTASAVVPWNEAKTPLSKTGDAEVSSLGRPQEETQSPPWAASVCAM